MAYLKLILISSLLGICQGRIDGTLLWEVGPRGRTDVLINFHGDNSVVIKHVNGRAFLNRVDKIKSLTNALQAHTETTQGPVKTFLKGQGVQSQSFWSSNQMVVRNASLNLLRGINSFPQVNRIQKLPIVKLEPIISEDIEPTADTVEWGVAKIQANQVWSAFGADGAGVVVANIDTGVRGTHEALAGNFRQDHGWYDPYTNTTFPDDGNGHGSHTMGTICGKGGIGVAPGAKWIACRGCGSDSCDSAQLLACGQFMLSPTNPDGTDPQPSLVPDVVSNSWGSMVGGDNWYNATIEAWTAAGILHAFAIGNSGPACRSGGSPGDQPSTFSVGSTDKNDYLSVFSSKGPAGNYPRTYIKPDITAPGSQIRSSWNTNDTAYNTIDGTSMATPHVAGTMALMLSAYRAKTPNGKISQAMINENIQKTADTQSLGIRFPNYRCDSVFQGSGKYPNNQFGYGRVNALNAVNVTLSGA